MWKAQIFTLYPEVFPGPLNQGLYGKALAKKLWKLKVVNIRDFAKDKHKTVDDTPFGGGSGMLLKADVLAKSIDICRNSQGVWFGTMPRQKSKLSAAPATEKMWARRNSLQKFVLGGVCSLSFFFHTVRVPRQTILGNN